MKCKACRKNNSIVIDNSAPLCGKCIARVGQCDVRPGTRVVCETTDECSGVVRRIVDDSLAVIDTRSGEVWIPLAELVAAS